MNIISLSFTFRSVDTLLLSDRSVVLCKQTNNHPNHKTNKQKNRKQNKKHQKTFFSKNIPKNPEHLLCETSELFLLSLTSSKCK